MNSWIVDSLNSELLASARSEAARRILLKGLGLGVGGPLSNDRSLQLAAEGLELAAFDLLDSDDVTALRTVSAEAFQLMRVLPQDSHPLIAAQQLLRLSCLGVLGDRTVEAARILREQPWPKLPLDSPSWGARTLATILDIWLRLIRKSGWGDLEAVQAAIVTLREAQKTFEAEYLEKLDGNARSAAWELVALYHLSKAAEVQAIYTTQGQVEGHFDVREQLESQFDRALRATDRAELINLNTLVRMVARTARQMVDNSIWTVTRAVNSRVTKFVNTLMDKARTRPIFEMLPPQRRTLREQGLLGSGHRSVVVNLPTSSGKTFIAQFRLLQALNQFDHDCGWTVYLAPTRALVNQVCKRLRTDFAPLGINVERVSPALEIDGLEASMLTDKDKASQFRILVTTPEKLDLMLRGDWEEKVGRPLTLVVVDEAHGIGQNQRGIKLELLLATINRECKHAQFLLLTPFIKNAAEIAKWLSPDSNTSIELGLDWQPNDRAITLAVPVRGKGRGQFTVQLQTLHTSKNTLAIPESLGIGATRPLGKSWSDVTGSASKLAAATAQILKARGPVVVLASRPSYVWSLAESFKVEANKKNTLSPDVALAKRYLAHEFGEDFELCNLLDYGVGVHHSGLSDEAKFLMEWLLERDQIDVLVATTTIAQGVNFPVTGVVIAQNSYYDKVNGTVPMPPEDFWNIAGRAGRVEQGSLGIIALVATSAEKQVELTEFVNKQVDSLNSTLIAMVQSAIERFGELQLHLLYARPEWSAFLQYLCHTYREIGDADKFASEIEQVLRGTLGFQNLRKTHSEWATKLVSSVQAYGQRISGKPLKLVDSTGFSWESVSQTLVKLGEQNVTEAVWNPQQLFGANTGQLGKLMGILLNVPELRDNLIAATGGPVPDGDLLASMVKDWVNGDSISKLAKSYFSKDKNGNELERTASMTECCRNIFGRLTQTAAWGLAALQTMTFKDEFDKLTPEEQQTLRNVPARVYYGVNSDEAIALRLLGVPRGAAQKLADVKSQSLSGAKLTDLRAALIASESALWTSALGDAGKDYRDVWRILEGLASQG